MEHPEHAHQAFSKDILGRISHNIADAEEATGADIRISIRDLREAGDADMSVKELAEKAGTNYRNVAVWFATTGKKNPKIKKLAPATYKLAA